MEYILCAKDMGDGCSPSVNRVKCEIPSGGVVIRLVGIGDTDPGSSAAEDGDLDMVWDGPARLVVTLGPGADHLGVGNSSGPVGLVLACLQKRRRGVGAAILLAPSSPLV